MAQPKLKIIQAAVRAARGAYEVEGELEIDDTPETLEAAEVMVSACDEWKEEGGMYVKAWVWVTGNQITDEL